KNKGLENDPEIKKELVELEKMLLAKKYFEDLEKEKINTLFKNAFPWESLKYLKEYLLDNIAEINKNIPIEVPLSESLFFTSEGEVIPLKEIEIYQEDYYFQGQKMEGAILKAGSV
ncbi:hypothetical protein, partial [Escherichia coli]|uniref:hypothetical protein n=1 Tax=Escherichia coli TaxID=562 RepID=UPI001386C9AF